MFYSLISGCKMSRCPAKGTSWHVPTLKTHINLCIHHLVSLTRVFNRSSMGSQGSNVSSVEKLRLWSYCVGVQTDLNLSYMHMQTCTLCWIQAQMYVLSVLIWVQTFWKKKSADDKSCGWQGEFINKTSCSATSVLSIHILTWNH